MPPAGSAHDEGAAAAGLAWRPRSQQPRGSTVEAEPAQQQQQQPGPPPQQQKQEQEQQQQQQQQQQQLLLQDPRHHSHYRRRRLRRPRHRRHHSASGRAALEQELARRLNGSAGARCSCARAAAFAVTGLVLMCDGQEMLVMGLVTPHLRRQWKLGPVAEGSLGASVFAGVLVGSLVGGLLSDAWGRRPSLLLCAGLLSCFGVAAAFAPNLAALIALRSLAGVALGGTLPVTSALLAEISSDKWRGALMVLGGVGFVLGEMLTAAEAVAIDLSDGDRNWRVLMGISALPAVLCLVVGLLFLEESPRWHLTQGRVADMRAGLDSLDAKRVSMCGAPIVATRPGNCCARCKRPRGVAEAARVADANAGDGDMSGSGKDDGDGPGAGSETTPLIAAAAGREEGRYGNGAASLLLSSSDSDSDGSFGSGSGGGHGAAASVEARSGDQGRGGGGRRRHKERSASGGWRAGAAGNPCGRLFLRSGCANTWLLWTVWWVCSLVYYGIVWILPSTLGETAGTAGGRAAQQRISLEVLLSALGELVGVGVVAALLNPVGRRNIMMISFAISAVTAAACALLAPSPTSDVPAHTGFVYTATVLKMVVSIVFTVIYVYTAELYSSAERGTAIGAGSAASRVGGILTPYLSTTLHRVGVGVPFYMFSAASLTGLVAVFILPNAPRSIR